MKSESCQKIYGLLFQMWELLLVTKQPFIVVIYLRIRHAACDGALQDGVLSQTTAYVSSRLLVSLLPQWQG